MTIQVQDKGQPLLKRAQKQHEERQRTVRNNIEQSAKEGADYLVNRAKGKKIFY